jgi:hypothetical protein
VANYRVSTNTNSSNKTTQDETNNKTTTKETTKQRKMDQLRRFTLKYDLLKISLDLQTAFAAKTHLAEGQWLKEQLNLTKLSVLRVGTRMPNVSRAEGQCLVPLKTLNKNNASNNNNNNNNNNTHRKHFSVSFKDILYGHFIILLNYN